MRQTFQLQTQKGHNTLGVSKAAGGDTSPYIDLKDAQWECKGDLLPVKVQDLKPSDFVVYTPMGYYCGDRQLSLYSRATSGYPFDQLVKILMPSSVDDQPFVL